MHQVPYIYSGAINDNSISEVFAADKPAKILNVQGDKRFYVIGDTKDAEVRMIKQDGSEETIEEVDQQLFKNWKK